MISGCRGVRGVRPRRLAPALFGAALALLAASAAIATPATPATPAAPAATSAAQPSAAGLPERYRTWLEEVDVLLTAEERAAFLALTRDYQRDAFIERFWAERDPNPRTSRNELREHFEANVKEARARFGDLHDGRARVLLLNGPPEEVVKSDCPLVLWPLEVWYYSTSDRVKGEFFVILYRKWGGGPYRIWDPLDGVGDLFAEGVGDQRPNPMEAPGGHDSRIGDRSTPRDDSAASSAHSLERILDFNDGCGSDDHAKKIVAGIAWVSSQGLDWIFLRAKLEGKPEGPGGEWVSGFESYSTDVPPGAELLPARLDLEFPGRLQGRTVVQGVLTVPAAAAAVATLGPARSFNLQLNGDVLVDGRLFEHFRYKFDLPAFATAPARAAAGAAVAGEKSAVSGSLPLAFQRQLRPGEYTLVVRLEDVNSGRFYREERPLTVPAVERAAPAPGPDDPETARLFAEATAALASGETTLRLIPPVGELQTGLLRVDTMAAGDIAQVTFTLDGRPVLTKKRPPFSVELDLGATPQAHFLGATAFDGGGNAVARDEIALNAPGNRFRVRLLEPRRGQRYEKSLLARAEVDVPEGEELDRLELFLDDERVATLYQPPFVHPLVLAGSGALTYVRAVAYLRDGATAESLAFVNAPEELAEMRVDFVELYTTVADRFDRPVTDLGVRDFAVAEDGRPQALARCERVTDLPVHVAIALDISASMERSLGEAQAAALRFFSDSVRPKDRAALVTFNDHPQLVVKFTSDVPALAAGLTGLKAERGTSLYDSLIFTLYAFNGVKGRRAILLLSDGRDEGSRFGFDAAREFARRAGVTLYVIGLGEKVDKTHLARLAEETGGRAFFLRDAGELGAIYTEIDRELRSQLLLAYQSNSNRIDRGFRSVEVEVKRSGLTARTIRGYFP